MDLLGTDLTKIGGAYATFAGVLAGFVFVVVGYLLGNRPREGSSTLGRNLELTLSWPVCAFVAMSIASFLFALLSGEDRFSDTSGGLGFGTTRMRPLVLSILASGVLSIAVLLLLLGLIWLFKYENSGRVLLGQLRGVVHLTSLLTLLYVDGTFTAIPIALDEPVPNDLTSLLPAATIFLLSTILGDAVGYLLRRTNEKVLDIVRVTTQSGIVLLVFVCAGVFNFVENMDDSNIPIRQVLDLRPFGLIALGAVFFLCIVNLPGRRPMRSQ
jgi:hypothetical protein